MKPRIDIWGILIVTAITALVWHRAAQQTAVEETRLYVLEATAELPEPENYLVTPASVNVSLLLKGPTSALRAIPGSDFIPVEIPFVREGNDFKDASLPLDAFVQSYFEDRGVAIVSVDPPTQEFSITPIVSQPRDVTLRPIPGVTLTSEIDPPIVNVKVPDTLRIRSAEARLIERDVQRLEPGTRRTFTDVEVAVTLNDGSDVDTKDIDPPVVSVQVDIERQFVVKELRVRVQLAGPGEDNYTVEFDPPSLLVNLKIPTDLDGLLGSAAPSARKPQLIGLVHLGSAEKEAAVAGGVSGKKPIGMFVAVMDGAFRVLEFEGDAPPAVGYEVTKTTP